MTASLRLVADSPTPPADTQPEERVALVTGASSGIGLGLVNRLLADDRYASIYAGCREPMQCFALTERAAEEPRLKLLQLNVTDNSSVKAAAAEIASAGCLDLVINTAGILHTPEGMRPEKRVADINTDDLLLAYDVNALGAMRLAVELESLLEASKSPRFVSLSARVGSIEDNRLGGWYAYRASKAALNMLLKTLAIEWRRHIPNLVCVALHPGTVSTALSDPYKGGSNRTFFTPEESAGYLLNVLEDLGPEHSGGFYAWDGKEIPW